MPSISPTEIRQINNQREPNGLLLPIVVASMEATPVTLSLSHLSLPSTKLMQKCPAAEDLVNVTSSVVKCIGGMLMMGLGFLNGIWLTIVLHSIRVHKTTKARFPIVSS